MIFSFWIFFLVFLALDLRLYFFLILAFLKTLAAFDSLIGFIGFGQRLGRFSILFKISWLFFNNSS